jgi:hypothetical protein
MSGSVRASLGLVKDDRLLLLGEGIACATSTRLLRAAPGRQYRHVRRLEPVDPRADRLSLGVKLTGAAGSILADEQAADAISAATGGDGFDVVIDATGSRASMEDGFHYVAHGGTFVLVSVVKDDINFSDAEFHKREMTLVGAGTAPRSLLVPLARLWLRNARVYAHPTIQPPRSMPCTVQTATMRPYRSVSRRMQLTGSRPIRFRSACDESRPQG